MQTLAGDQFPQCQNFSSKYGEKDPSSGLATGQCVTEKQAIIINHE